jgi:hypothetical protein
MSGHGRGWGDRAMLVFHYLTIDSISLYIERE